MRAGSDLADDNPELWRPVKAAVWLPPCIFGRRQGDTDHIQSMPWNNWSMPWLRGLQLQYTARLPQLVATAAITPSGPAGTPGV